MRTIDNLLESFRSGLQSISSPLSNFTRYSNVYILARALIYPILLKQSDLELVKNSIFISTATGVDLDNRGAEFGLLRSPGSKATGGVLLSGSIPNIPAGTLLSTSDGKYQYTISNDVLANSTFASIESVGTDERYNLQAGIRLYNSLYSSTVFTIGITREGNTYRGDLLNGRRQELDDEFRSRIISFVSSRDTSSTNSILNIISALVPETKILIYESSFYPGVFEVYVNSNDLALLNLIDEQIALIKPLGTLYRVSSLQYTPIYFSIELSVCPGCDINQAIVDAKATINRVLSSKSFNETIRITEIYSALSSLTDILYVSILTPNADITLPDRTIPLADEIKVTII